MAAPQAAGLFKEVGEEDIPRLRGMTLFGIIKQMQHLCGVASMIVSSSGDLSPSGLDRATLSSDIERYKAAMVLSGAGDALGYKNQEWEYCTSGPQIHKELAELGGLKNISVTLPGWPISDDTVMHLALAEALVSGKSDGESMLLEIARGFKECMHDMEGRKPGPTSIKGCDLLQPDQPKGYQIPFNPTGRGCGAAMRSMCLGLRYPRPEDLDKLIMYSIESGRMTHHHPTGFLGALASALLVSYAMQGRPINSWGQGLLHVLPKAMEYIESAGLYVKETKEVWGYFVDKWRWYLEQRGLIDGKADPKFPEKYGVVERDEIYRLFSIDGWAGRSGHDAPMIAYDALLASKDNWEELCSRSMFHAGDSDSTGVIAAACFGAMYGYKGVPEGNYKPLEYRSRIEEVAEKLFKLSRP